jgi:hypothetical protein
MDTGQRKHFHSTTIIFSYTSVSAVAQNGVKRAKKKEYNVVKKQKKRDKQRINQTITQACGQFNIVCSSRKSCYNKQLSCRK